MQVLAATSAARDAVTFTLALPGTRRAPAAYKPGQFITLAFPAGAGSRNATGATGAPILYRSYSLCGDGRAEEPWQITVKRTPHGVVSTFLLDHIRPGMLLRASMPNGTFTLPSDLRPETTLVFVAGGSGITPIYAMLRGLDRLDARHRPRVWLHYAYASPADAIFGRELAALDPEGRWLSQRHYVSSAGQRLQPDRVLAALGAEAAAAAEWYVCGPAGLKRGLEAKATRYGVPARRLHSEVFASPIARDTKPFTPTASTQAAAASVRLADTGAVLNARSGETLLETLERHGYRPDFSCRAGACGTCRLRLLAGQVRDGAGESGALSASECAQGYILSCVAQPRGNVTLASAGAPVADPRRAGPPPVSGARRASRAGTRKALRVSLAAAALGLFMSVWGLTSHNPTTSIQSSTTSGGSSSTSASGNSSGTNNSSASSNSSNGSSSITTQSGSSSASTSSGVS